MSEYLAQLNQDRIKDKNKKKTKTKSGITQPDTKITDVEFMIIGFIAMSSDACDWIGLDLLLFHMIDLITSGILGLWCLMRLRQFPTTRFGGTLLIELIPGLGDLSPTWTIFIFSLYVKQKGLAQLTK
ncbi:hypothetical protein KKE74_02740 [Patescibacteria group bacterium]|nr:hypothetical protein [Patescibacteria group bacterium]MBU2472924.1 hypothetical protein [Patescibacteria group bacterium]